jgi:antitoxin component YwqK of YwqJK toxin-antitoxin module
MRKILIAVALVALLGCGREKTVVEEKYPDGSVKKEVVYAGQGDKRVRVKETDYYPGKRVKMTGDFRNDKRNGHWVFYYENGKKWSEGDFRDGKSNGKRITYFESGKIRYEGEYRDDVRTGKWRFYDETGALIKEVDYTPKAQ